MLGLPYLSEHAFAMPVTHTVAACSMSDEDMIAFINQLEGVLEASHPQKGTMVANICGRHLSSAYSQHQTLRESFSIIQQKWHQTGEGALKTSEKRLIAEKIAEGSDNCSAGFHDRVNEIIIPWQYKYSLETLLHRLRTSLINRAAYSLTDEVHAHNRFFLTAQLNGYGVSAPNIQDVYCGEIRDEVILESIKQTLQVEYQPVAILKHLINDLECLLREQYGYRGQSEGYKAEDYEKWFAVVINPLLDQDLKIQISEGLLMFDSCMDMNWNLLLKVLFIQLNREGVFDLPEPMHDAFLDLLNETKPYQQEVDYVSYLKPLTPTFESLFKLLSFMPSVDKKQLFFNHYLQSIADPAKKTAYLTKLYFSDLNIDESWKADLRIQFNSIAASPIHGSSEQFINLLFERPFSDSLFKDYLNYLQLMEHEEQCRILLATRDGLNVLMFTALEAPRFMPDVLQIIGRLDTPIQEQIFTHQSEQSRHVFMYALLKKHPDAGLVFFRHILDKKLSQQIQANILKQKVYDYSLKENSPVFLLALRGRSTELVSQLLTMLKNLNEDDKKEILTTQRMGYASIYTLIAYYHPLLVPEITSQIITLPYEVQAILCQRNDDLLIKILKKAGVEWALISAYLKTLNSDEQRSLCLVKIYYDEALPKDDELKVIIRESFLTMAASPIHTAPDAFIKRLLNAPVFLAEPFQFYFNCLKLMPIQEQADILSAAYNGWNILMVAVFHSSSLFAEVLNLVAHLDIQTQEKILTQSSSHFLTTGDNALLLAAINGKNEMCLALLNFIKQASFSHTGKAKILMESPLWQVPGCDRNPFLYALDHCTIQVARQFLDVIDHLNQADQNSILGAQRSDDETVFSLVAKRHPALLKKIALRLMALSLEKQVACCRGDYKLISVLLTPYKTGVEARWPIVKAFLKTLSHQSLQSQCLANLYAQEEIADDDELKGLIQTEFNDLAASPFHESPVYFPDELSNQLSFQFCINALRLLPLEQQADILQRANDDNWTILMFAINHYPESVPDVVSILRHHDTRIQQDVVLKMATNEKVMHSCLP